jgi:hypothetical protein
MSKVLPLAKAACTHPNAVSCPRHVGYPPTRSSDLRRHETTEVSVWDNNCEVPAAGTGWHLCSASPVLGCPPASLLCSLQGHNHISARRDG